MEHLTLQTNLEIFEYNEDIKVKWASHKSISKVDMFFWHLETYPIK